MLVVEPETHVLISPKSDSSVHLNLRCQSHLSVSFRNGFGGSILYVPRWIQELCNISISAASLALKITHSHTISHHLIPFSQALTQPLQRTRQAYPKAWSIRLSLCLCPLHSAPGSAGSITELGARID